MTLLAQRILSHLPYEPNDQQYQLIAALARYIVPPEGSQPAVSADRVFLLNGYAGTGKTTVIGALVKALADCKVKTVLLAPTGRAAKVLSAACKHPAYTIHRRIYRGDTVGVEGMYSPIVNENRMTDAVFIVDEASMIGGDTSGGSSLLHDLIYYVFSGINCRLILLGDSAQLPPVGCTESPAMSREVLKSMGLHTTRAVITETARQKPTSGILYNATRQRRSMLKDPLPVPTIYASPFDDVSIIDDPEEMASMLRADYMDDENGGIDRTIIITRSNKRATEFNTSVRKAILDYEEELTVGERLLVVKNNYYWGAKLQRLDFIANGDVAIVERIIGTEERYGLRFADVELYLPDREARLECKIMLDTLSSLSPSLDAAPAADFERRIFNDPDLFTSSMSVEQRRRALRSNPYYQALQVKYGYCVTCHKAQGGQWANVYVDTGYIHPESTCLDLYRWLYTATTRATHRLHFINPLFPVK